MFRWFIFISSVLIIFGILELIFGDNIRGAEDQRFMQKSFNLVYYGTINFGDNFETGLKITKSKIDKIRGVVYETQDKIDSAKQTIEEAKKVVDKVSEVNTILTSTGNSLTDNINKITKIVDTFSGTGEEIITHSGIIENYNEETSTNSGTETMQINIKYE